MKKCSKKLDGMQDDNTEVSNVEELEQNDASPATVQSFPADIESPMTPLSNAQDEKLPSGSEGSIPLRFDRTPPGAPLPIGWPNDSCIADDVGGQSVVEVRRETTFSSILATIFLCMVSNPTHTLANSSLLSSAGFGNRRHGAETFS